LHSKVARNMSDRFQAKVKKEESRYLEELEQVKEAMDNSSARYRGQPIDFLHYPLFVSWAEVEELERILHDLTKVLRKAVRHYLEEPDFRKFFGFPPQMEELIIQDPGYSLPFPIGRFDIFRPEEGPIQFCELNTDGSSGMNEARALQETIGDTGLLRETKGDHNLFSFDPFQEWIEAILDNYAEFLGREPDDPTIAIVDFEGEGIESEFREFKRKFRAAGYQTFICDPRWLNYDGGRLTYEGQEIDLVYRRATTARIVDRMEEVGDFLSAYRDGAVCVVGGFRSQIVHDKVIFAVLGDEDKSGFLTEEEREFVSNHIPETRVLKEEDRKLLARVKKEKDLYLLKPRDRFAGHGICIGRDCNADRWEELVEEKGEEDDYLVQRFCDVPTKRMPYVEEGEIHWDPFNYLMGLYIYNESLAGMYTRVGRENLIGSIVECFTVPNFVVD